MVKSEITNDQSEARDKALNSPLFRLIDQTWRNFDEEISQPVRLKEEDIVRYVVWSIETIKGEAKPSMSCQDLRRNIVNLFRDIKYPSEVSEPLSNIICAYVIVCLDCAFMYSYRQDIKSLCFAAENSLHEKFKQNVLEYKEKIKNRILQSGASSELGDWCADYLLNKEFYTDEDAEWVKNVSSSSTMQSGESEDQKNNNGQDEEIKPDITSILKYCSDPEKCKTIVQMLSGCETVDALKSALISIDADGKMIDMYTMDNLQFCRDIIPLIGYQTNDTALKQVIHRLIKS